MTMWRRARQGDPLFSAEEAASLTGYLARQDPPRIRIRQPETVTRATIPWKRLAKEEVPRLALSEADIDALAAKHDVPAERLGESSASLRSVITEEPALSQPDLAPARRKAGLKKVQRMMADADGTGKTGGGVTHPG